MEDNILENVGLEEQPDKSPDIIAEAIDKMDKDIFFTAASARSKTTAVHKKKLEVEMLPIYKRINEAINSGEYRINGIVLTKEQRKFLDNRNFRYTLKNQTSGDSYNCILYWD